MPPNPPKPEVVDIQGTKFEGYYQYTEKGGAPTRPDPNRPHYYKKDLPEPKPGYTWTNFKNARGEVYFIQRSSAVIDPIRKQQAEIDKREAERRARERAEAAAPKADNTAFRPGEERGLDAVKRTIEARRQQVSDILGGKVSVSALGQSKEILSAGVSTSVKGTEIGPATVDANGNVVAMKVGGATVTEDSRVIVGGSVERKGVKVSGKIAVNAGNAVVGTATKITETVVDALEKRLPGLGEIKAD
jgi:hypothetical protein